MEARDRLLEAALRVFQEVGSRGATTRRIASEAGVNEVTLFRLFGSKAALLSAALHSTMGLTSPGTLPAVPVRPEAELVAWVRERMRSLLERRDMIRTCMAEVSQVPERAGPVAERPVQMARELATYLREMQARGMADPAVNASAAAAMLMGAMFTDVMTRDMMPDRFGYTQADAPALYTGLLLRAVGAAPQPARGPAPRLRRTNTNDERRPS